MSIKISRSMRQYHHIAGVTCNLTDLAITIHGNEAMLLSADSNPFHIFSVHLVQSSIDRRKTPLKYKAININQDTRCHKT